MKEQQRSRGQAHVHQGIQDEQADPPAIHQPVLINISPDIAQMFAPVPLGQELVRFGAKAMIVTGVGVLGALVYNLATRPGVAMVPVG